MIADKYKHMKGVPPNKFRAKIVETLTISRFGHASILLNHLFRQGSIVSCFKQGGVEYVIGELLKIDGNGNSLHRIRKCCGKRITNIDKEILKKDNILHVLFLPLGDFNQNYTI